jgi:peptide deformylase
VPKEAVGQPALERLIDDMIDTMREYEGVGLAATQVHQPIQLVVIEARGENPEREVIPLTILLNPQYVELSDEKDSDWEGCLSVGDLRGMVPRSRRVVVEALDREGQPVTVKAEGFFARVLQHEIDHLHGAVFLDRMEDLRYLAFTREFARYWLGPQQAEPGPEE